MYFIRLQTYLLLYTNIIEKYKHLPNENDKKLVVNNFEIQ